MPNLVMFKDLVVQSMTGRSYAFKARQPLHVSNDDVAVCKEKGAMDEDEALAIIGAIKAEDDTQVSDDPVPVEGDEGGVSDESADTATPAAQPAARRSRS